MDRAEQARLEEEPLLRTATEWFLELRGNEVSVERIAEWQQWLAVDAENSRAFDRVEKFWRVATQAVTTHWPTDEEIEADAYDGTESISQWRSGVSVRGGLSLKPAHSRLGLAATVMLAVAALGWTLSRWPQWTILAQSHANMAIDTRVAESRTLTLPDGSTVALSGATSVTGTFAFNAREVTLERGEAFFHVAKDVTRPFTVHAGSTTVTAIGTAFNVRRTGEGVVVAVSEGSVRVAAPESGRFPVASGGAAAELKVGEQLSLERAGAVPHVASIDTESVAGWRRGRLQYVNEPLESVVADLARYSTRKIRIADRQVASLRVTGIVFQQNIDGWLASLAATFPVKMSPGLDGSVELERER